MKLIKKILTAVLLTLCLVFSSNNIVLAHTFDFSGPFTTFLEEVSRVLGRWGLEGFVIRTNAANINFSTAGGEGLTLSRMQPPNSAFLLGQTVGDRTIIRLREAGISGLDLGNAQQALDTALKNYKSSVNNAYFTSRNWEMNALGLSGRLVRILQNLWITWTAGNIINCAFYTSERDDVQRKIEELEHDFQELVCDSDTRGSSPCNKGEQLGDLRASLARLNDLLSRVCPQIGRASLVIEKNGLFDDMVVDLNDHNKINCSPTCSATYGAPSEGLVAVTLKAIPGPGRFFRGWERVNCGEELICTFFIREGQVKIVRANFGVSAGKSLRIELINNEPGDLVSDLRNLQCGIQGGSCLEYYPTGTRVEVRASTRLPGRRFVEWFENPSEGARTEDTYQVVMDRDRVVRAMFGRLPSIPTMPSSMPLSRTLIYKPTSLKPAQIKNFEGIVESFFNFFKQLFSAY